MTYHSCLSKTVESNLPLVKKIAGKYRSKSNKYLFNYNDLTQEGVCGLIKAHKRYDKSKAKFSTFAYTKIRGSIIDYLRTFKNNSDNTPKVIHISTLSEQEIENIEESIREDPNELFEHLCKGLDKREKEIAYQAFILKNKYSEIASSLGISVSLVTQIINDNIYFNFKARINLFNRY